MPLLLPPSLGTWTASSALKHLHLTLFLPSFYYLMLTMIIAPEFFYRLPAHNDVRLKHSGFEIASPRFKAVLLPTNSLTLGKVTSLF